MVINGKKVVVVIRTLGQPVSDPLPFGVNRLNSVKKSSSLFTRDHNVQFFRNKYGRLIDIGDRHDDALSNVCYPLGRDD